MDVRLTHDEAQLIQAVLADALDILQWDEREMAENIIAKLAVAADQP
jgi:hypothetical protein